MIESYSNFSQRISEVSSTTVGKEQLLGKQLLLSAWELITDSPTSVQCGEVLNMPQRNGEGRVKRKKAEGKDKEKAQLHRLN